MDEMRTFQVTGTYRVEVDTASWALAYGLDATDGDALGEHVREWLSDAVQQSLPLAEGVTGSVVGEIVGGPVEIMPTPVERFTVEFAESKRGCWLESSRGWRAASVLVAIAQELGMVLSPDDRKVIEVYADGDWPSMMERLTLPSGEVISMSDVGEYVTGQGELCEQAEAWLNKHIAPEGWSFGWHNGEFMLWSESDWADVAE
jgi:hypothetical protein